MNAALYMRMSTDMQENSIDSQKSVLLSYARNNKIHVVQKYIDEGISGRTAEKRPAFMQMIEDSAKGEFDAVLVYDSSRFARNLEESIVYKSTLKRNGVKLISITEPTLDDDSALITDAMLGALNEMYSRKLSKAVKRGMIYGAEKGNHQTCVPFGYRKAECVMTIFEEEAEIVQKVFEMFAELPSFRSVAIKLNALGLKKKNGKVWAAFDVRRMLQNSTYIGNVNYCGEVYKGNHEPIIKMELWNEVQRIIDEKPKRKSRAESTYKHWLSGLIICSYCESKMAYKTGRSKNPLYQCNGSVQGQCGHTNSMIVPKFEELFKDALENIVTNEDLRNYKFFTPKTDKKSKKDILNDSLNKVRQKLERHKVAYSSGIDTIDEYKENKEKCLQEEKELMEQIELLSSETISEAQIKEFKNAVSNISDLIFSDIHSTEQKSISLKTIVEKIVFKNTGQFDVYFFI